MRRKQVVYSATMALALCVAADTSSAQSSGEGSCALPSNALLVAPAESEGVWEFDRTRSRSILGPDTDPIPYVCFRTALKFTTGGRLIQPDAGARAVTHCGNQVDGPLHWSLNVVEAGPRSGQMRLIVVAGGKRRSFAVCVIEGEEPSLILTSDRMEGGPSIIPFYYVWRGSE